MMRHLFSLYGMSAIFAVILFSTCVPNINAGQVDTGQNSVLDKDQHQHGGANPTDSEKTDVALETKVESKAEPVMTFSGSGSISPDTGISETIVPGGRDAHYVMDWNGTAEVILGPNDYVEVNEYGSQDGSEFVPQKRRLRLIKRRLRFVKKDVDDDEDDDNEDNYPSSDKRRLRFIKKDDEVTSPDKRRLRFIKKDDEVTSPDKRRLRFIKKDNEVTSPDKRRLRFIKKDNEVTSPDKRRLRFIKKDNEVTSPDKRRLRLIKKDDEVTSPDKRRLRFIKSGSSSPDLVNTWGYPNTDTTAYLRFGRNGNPQRKISTSGHDITENDDVINRINEIYPDSLPGLYNSHLIKRRSVPIPMLAAGMDSDVWSSDPPRRHFSVATDVIAFEKLYKRLQKQLGSKLVDEMVGKGKRSFADPDTEKMRSKRRRLSIANSLYALSSLLRAKEREFEEKQRAKLLSIGKRSEIFTDSDDVKASHENDDDVFSQMLGKFVK